MISINIEDLKDETNDLKKFLESKLGVEVKIEGKLMDVGSTVQKLSRGNVKDYVERFFYRKGLYDVYKVRSDKNSIKIVKKEAK